MTAETIRLPNGKHLTGRLVDHLGDGRVEIDLDGRRYVGRKASAARREAVR